MAEPLERRSFSFRKTVTGVDFQIPVNFEETLKDVKPPIIPPLFRSVCEEILARIASRQLSILPAPLSALFFNADAMGESLQWTAQIDEVIKLLHFQHKGLSEKQRILKRKADLEPHQTSVITRAMFRYIELCSGGVDLTIEFPAYGYLILGPSLQNEGKADLKTYLRSLDAFIRAALEKNPIKRDIFCYFMHFLSQIYQLMGESYRSQPALCGMTRYLLANRFGEELITLFCTECQTRIDESQKGCRVCSYIPTQIKPPYETQVIDMMLEYIPLSYWREKLNDPRGGLAERSGTAPKLDQLNFIPQTRRVSSVGDLPHIKSTHDKGRRTSKVEGKISFAGSSRNNGVSLRKSRPSAAFVAEEPRESVKNKESGEGADKSDDSQEPNDKVKLSSQLGNGAGSDVIGSSRRSGTSGVISGPKSIGGRRSGGGGGGGGGGEGGGSGIITSALRKDSISSISLTRRHTPSSGMRSTLFTTPPTLSHESMESTASERTDRTLISTPRRQVKRKHRRGRSRTRKPRSRSVPRKNRQRTRSAGRKKKNRARSPRDKKEVGKSRGKKGTKKTPRSKKGERARSKRR